MADASSAEIEIRALLDQWAQAACLGDLSGVVAHHAADVLMFDVPRPVQLSGLDAYRRSWQLFFSSNEAGPGRFRLRDLKVVAGQDVAVAYGLLDIADTAALCRLTVALVRGEDGWQVIHEHHSMPID